MNKFKKQMNKGLIEIAILKSIGDGDKYGYAIIKLINSESRGIMDIKDGTLYPILYRLEDNLHIESYWGESTGLRAKPRKYYKITEVGKEYLKESLKDYFEIIEGMSYILGRKEDQ